MTAPVFFVDREQLNAVRCRISGDEGRHAATVKRMRMGERLEVCDGMGNRASGLVIALGKDWVDLDIDERNFEPPSDVQFVAIQAVAKGDRADLALEILTEVGIDRIIPWKSRHSIAKWDDSGKSLHKWQRVAREASKQARRSWIPQVDEAVTTTELAEILPTFDVVVVLHESAEASLSGISVPSSGTVAIVIGPEGGISTEEVESLQSLGAHVVRMGTSIMRTSTAGGSALAVLASKTERWNSQR